MKETLSYSDEENYDDAENLYAMFESMDKCPIPVVGVVEGFALPHPTSTLGVALPTRLRVIHKEYPCVITKSYS